MGLDARASSSVTPLRDDVAAELRGGGCGNTWKSGTVACAGQVMCNSLTVDCSTKTFVSFVKNGAGDFVEDATVNINQCKVCSTGAFTCGNTVKTVTSTKGCTSSN